MNITPTTQEVVNRLEDYKGGPFLINEIAKDLETSWSCARTAVTKLIDLEILEIAEQHWNGYVFYRKTRTFKSKLKQLRKKNILT